MNIFGADGAWPLGFRLLAGRTGGQAVILIGLGIVLPLALRLGAPGGIAGQNPAMFVEGIQAGSFGPFAAAAIVAGYLLQVASYFGAWRLGLDDRESIAGAIGYGLVAAIVALLAIGVAGAVLYVCVTSLSAVPGLAAIVALILLVPLLALFAIYYTLLAAAGALVLGLAMAIMMVMGVALGDAGYAATLFGGGSGFVVVLLLVACGVGLWFAARLSCAGPIMAESRGFNLLAAARASWELTIDDGPRIMLYLALVGFGLAVLLFAFGAAMGLGLAATGLWEPGAKIAMAAITLIASVPVAYFSAAIPGGVYRALNRSGDAALVFA